MSKMPSSEKFWEAKLHKHSRLKTNTRLLKHTLRVAVRVVSKSKKKALTRRWTRKRST